MSSYCKKNSPDVSTTSKFLKVSFISNKKKHSTGAECMVECESDTTTPTSTGGSGEEPVNMMTCGEGPTITTTTTVPADAKNVTVPWSFGMEPQVLCVETGTTVIIEKTGSFHNVNMLATQSDYDNCTGFTDTAGNSDNPYIFQAEMQGSYYFACGVGT